jgi:hypothetical protein
VVTLSPAGPEQRPSIAILGARVVFAPASSLNLGADRREPHHAQAYRRAQRTPL